MTPNEFCYWLQGWSELEGGKKPSLEQWKLIQSHLKLVFNKITPDLETLLAQSDLGSFEEVEFPEMKDLGLYDESDLPERLPEDTEEAENMMERAFCAAVQDYDKLHPGMDLAPPSRGIPQVRLEPTPICAEDPTPAPDEAFDPVRKTPKNVRNDK